MYNKITIFLIVILLICFIISGTYVYLQYREDEEQEEIFEDLSNEIVENNTSEKEEDNTIDISKLYEQNHEFIGWLKIKDTNIDYPVMQTEKERQDYYLHRNFYKEYSQLGTPYIAEACNVQTSDNVIIYGHHITNNKMFGELEKYKKQNFYENHKIINFNTIYENADYEIIAVFKTVAYTGFKYYNFINANSKDEFDTFINKCKKLSFYNTEKTAEYGDKLLTLSTCEYSRKNGRLVVIAKKITNILEE